MILKIDFLNFKKLPKIRDLKPETYKDIKNLAWFSNGYYNIYKIGDNKYKYNDLRYPILDKNDPNSSVFSMLLFKDNKRLNMKSFEPRVDDLKKVMLDLVERIKGI